MTKKIIFFIVEGSTDKNTLQPILKHLFTNNKTHFHVVRGDITTNKNISDSTIIEEIKGCINSEMDSYGFKRSDIQEIVHLIDTDGAFIPTDRVLYDDVKRIEYKDNCIITSSRNSIIERNLNKASIVQKLCKLNYIYRKPYRVYYFSRNLEHALHGKIENLSITEKVELADFFADEYENNPHLFLNFIRGKNLAVEGNYDESWDFIFKDINSLNRHSNFHLCINRILNE